MSERDDSTGQFSSAEPLYGQAGIEAEAGYVPFKDGPAEYAPEELTPQEAAELISIPGSTPEGEIRTYSGISDLDDNVTLTIEQASKALSDSQDADEAEAELSEVARLQKEIDELRGVDPKKDQGKDAKPGAEAAPVKDGDLDPEKALNHPKIKEAISSQIAESETARQTFSKAADIALNFAQVSFAQSFPEVAGLPLDQWVPALTAMSQREPARFQAAVATLDRVAKLQNAQQFEQQRQDGLKQQEFQQFARAEDARLDDMLKGESRQSQDAITKEILAGAKEAGLEPSEFLKMFNSDRAMRHSAFQKMMVDAAKYRLMQKTKTAIAAKQVPPVQRPGSSNVARANSSTGKIQALEKQLDGATGTRAARLAADLHSLRSARG